MSKTSPGLEKLKQLHFRHRKGLLSAVSIDSVASAANDAETKNDQVNDGFNRAKGQQETSRGNPPKVAGSLVKEAAKLKAKIGDKCKVFVGNISYKVKTREVNDFFSYFGKVIHAQIIQDRVRKRSRGFGFVIFSNELEAERAKSATESERTLDGRVMTVLSPQRKGKGHTNEGKASLQEVVEHFHGRRNATKEHSTVESAVSNKDGSQSESEQSLIMEKLNDDTMLHIFCYLTVKERIQIERVCRRWRLLARKSWQRVISLDFQGIFVAFKGTGGLTDDILLSILRRGCHNLESLDLSASSHFLTDFAVHCISKNCKKLKQLDLTGVNLATSALKVLAKECTQLESIKLERCYNVGEKALWWLFKQCRYLRDINLANNRRLTGKCFFMLNDSCEMLHLEGCSQLTDAGLAYLGDNCQNLRSIDLSGCSCLTDGGMQQLFKKCTKIETFELVEPGRGVTAQGLIGLHNLKMLKHLTISRNEVVNDEVLYSIGRSCINLVSLNLEACSGGITDAGLQCLASCYQLKNIVISYLPEITDGSISQLAASGTLEQLVARACSGLTNGGVDTVLKHCPQLRLLDVSGCQEVSDRSLECAQEACALSDRPLLEFIVGGTSVSDEAVSLMRDTSRCRLDTADLSLAHLRTDVDSLEIGLLVLPSEEDDGDSESDDDDDLDEFHESGDSWFPDRGADEDFLVADDPSLVEEWT